MMYSWQVMRQRLSAQWHQRPLRERQIIGVASIVLVLLCVQLIWVQEAWRTRARLLRELPQTQSARADFKRLLDQARTQASASPSTALALQPAVRDSLSALNLDAVVLPGATATEMRLRFDAVGLEKALLWFDSLMQWPQVRIEALDLRRDRTDGKTRLSGSVTLRWHTDAVQ